MTLSLQFDVATTFLRHVPGHGLSGMELVCSRGVAEPVDFNTISAMLLP